MPKVTAIQEFELKTRSDYTKVDAEITIVVNGRELPSSEVVGRALEKAIEITQLVVTESYKKVPERV